MLTALVALAAASVATNFEAGSAGKSEWLSGTHLRVAVLGETDQDGRNRQPSWFYFRIDGVRGRDLTIDLSDLAGEYNYRPHDGSGLRGTLPVYSYDRRTWMHMEESQWIEGQSVLRFRLKPAADRVWVARQAPYTTRDLDYLLRTLRKHPHVSEEIVGKTVEGRPIRLLTITAPPAIASEGKPVVWLLARHHAWESGTSWVIEGALRFLTSGDPRAGRLRDEYVFRVFPMGDPDGVVRGGVRFNKNSYDLNRNWDAVDPKLMPEIHWQRKAILDWMDAGRRLDFFLTLHNTESADYIEGPLTAGGDAIARLGQRFWKLLDETTGFYSPKGPRDARVSTTPGRKGRMTVNQALFAERKIPAFLMEQMVNVSPKLGRCPTVKDRLEFGAVLVRIMAEAVAPPND